MTIKITKILTRLCRRRGRSPTAIHDPTSTNQDAIGIKLPQELIDIIIDHLQDDKRALATCSLVSRTWTPRTRHYLFTNFTLDGKKLKTFPKLGSAVMPFIRHFCVVDLFTTRDWNKILPLLVGFHRVSSLSFSTVSIPWRSLKSKPRLSLLHTFCDVVCLKLNFIRTKRFAELASIICAFPHLQTLVVRHLTCAVPPRNHSPLPSSHVSLSKNLRHLEILGFQAELLLQWFLSFETPPALRTVYLHELDDNADKRSITRRFLQAMGPTLESLCCNSYLHEGTLLRQHSIRPYYTISSAEFQHLVRLHNTSRLRTLHIVLRANNGQLDTSFVSFVHVLSQMASVDLDELAIYHTEHTRVAWEEWAFLDDVLSQPQFSKLKRINIYFLRLHPQSLYAVYLPRCLCRGLVHIQFVDSTPTYL